MSSTMTEASDVAGTPVAEGDTVAAVSGQLTGKVCEVRMEDGMEFVRVRPTFQPYGKGMWYAADQVFRVAKAPPAKPPPAPPPPSATPPLAPANKSAAKPQPRPAAKRRSAPARKK